MRETIEIVDQDMAAVLRLKTEAERLRIAWGMWRSARDMLRNLLRAERRDWTEQEIDREVARRLSHGACRPAP
ncbi:MAG: hypothetical protein JNM56_07530 [Planctomycetia bacterium]|nr:hypothetical protein [Planctomycetia bacterium]